MTRDVPQHVDLIGAQLVAAREAVVTHAYEDGKWPGGKTKWAIGIGSQTPLVHEGDVITVEEAIHRFRADIMTREPALNRMLRRQITQNQFNALFSLFYQAGTEATREVAELFNDGKNYLAMLRFGDFPYGENKVPTEGHAKRRQLEMTLGSFNVLLESDMIKVYDGPPKGPNKVAPVEVPFADLKL